MEIINSNKYLLPAVLLKDLYDGILAVKEVDRVKRLFANKLQNVK